MKSPLAPIKNWFWYQLYQAAERFGTPERARLPGPEPRDARFDIDNATRFEIIRKCRTIEANDGIGNRMGDIYEQFVAGPNGIRIVSDTDDDEWNEVADEYWEESGKFLDLSSRMPLAEQHSLCARREWYDGQIAVFKTFGAERDGIARPRTQLIESHRIRTPPDRARDEGLTIYDGWEVDKNGRPIFVYVEDRNDAGQTIFRRLRAESVNLIGQRIRVGQYNYLPYLHPVINDFQDLIELQQFTKQKAKDNSSITRIMTNPAGEVKNQQKSVRETLAQSNQNSLGADFSEERTKFLQRVFGPRSVALRNGETLQEFLNNTPTVADERLWSILTSRVCIGSGIPKIMIFPESVTQGTAIRGEYDIANAFFRSCFQPHAACWIDIRNFVIGWAINNVPGRISTNVPKNWRRATACPPRAPNVDVGRNSAAMLAELAVGATNYDLIYGPLGLSAKQELKKAAKFAAYIRKLATDYKITTGEINVGAAKALSEHAKALQLSAAKEKENEDDAIEI